MMTRGRSFRSKLAPYVERICSELDSSFFDLAAAVGKSPALLWKQLSESEGPGADTMARVADFLETTVDALLLRQVPVEFLARCRRGDVVFPERYMKGAGSKLRTSLPVLQYVSDKLSEKVVRNVLRDLCLTTAHLNDPESKVSIQLLADMMTALGKRGLVEEDFFEIGRGVTRTPAYREGYKRLHGVKDYKKLYEIVFEDMVPKSYEQNFTYRIRKSSGESMVIETKPNPAIQEALSAKVIDTPAVAAYRAGVISAHAGFAGLALPKVRCLASMRDGAPSYLYEALW